MSLTPAAVMQPRWHLSLFILWKGRIYVFPCHTTGGTAACLLDMPGAGSPCASRFQASNTKSGQLFRHAGSARRTLTARRRHPASSARYRYEPERACAECRRDREAEHACDGGDAYGGAGNYFWRSPRRLRCDRPFPARGRLPARSDHHPSEPKSLHRLLSAFGGRGGHGREWHDAYDDGAFRRDRGESRILWDLLAACRQPNVRHPYHVGPLDADDPL